MNHDGVAAVVRAGQLRDGVVSRSEMRGEPGKEIVDVAMDLACADGSVAILRVSVLPTLPPVGAVYGVLVDPAHPLVASVQPTGESVNTRDRAMEYADIGLRGVAAMIDLLLPLVAVAFIGALTQKITASGWELPTFGLGLGIGLAYYVVLEACYGWTIGKRVFGLRVVMLEGGGSLSWKASIVRNLIRVVDVFGFYLVAVITTDRPSLRSFRTLLLLISLVIATAAAMVVIVCR